MVAKLVKHVSTDSFGLLAKASFVSLQSPQQVREGGPVLTLKLRSNMANKLLLILPIRLLYHVSTDSFGLLAKASFVSLQSPLQILPRLPKAELILRSRPSRDRCLRGPVPR